VFQVNILPSKNAPRLGGKARSRRTWFALTTAQVVFLWFALPSSATDGIEPIDVSMQARARGGADVAVGDSALSQVDNPASLALRPRDLKQFDFSGQLIFPQVHWSGPIDSADSEIKLIPLANVGISIPHNEKLTFGFALHSKAGLAARYHIRHLLIPFWDRQCGADMKDISIMANAGYKLTDKLSIGAGLRAEIVTAKFSTVLGPVDAEFGRGYAYGGGFQLGLHYQATPDLTLGLSYRSPSWLTDVSGGEVEASLFGIGHIGVGKGNIDEFRLPQKITAGAAWDVTDWLKLIGEVRWKNYAKSSLNGCTVATDGLADLRIRLPMGYRDQWIFIVGAEFKLDEHWKFAVGYNYCTNPVPRDHLLPIGSVISQHHVTAGLRYEQDKWWVGGGYILGFTNSLSGNGRSKIPLGIDYALSEVSQTQHHLFLGFGFSWQ
jgi:long-chain fatty acid transport protein